MTYRKDTPCPLWIDDRCYENLLDLLEGKKVVSDEVLKNIIECGREKIAMTRSRYKASLTRIKNKHTFVERKTPKLVKGKTSKKQKAI